MTETFKNRVEELKKLSPNEWAAEIAKLDDMLKEGNCTAYDYISGIIPLLAAKRIDWDVYIHVEEEKDRRIEQALRPLAQQILRRTLEVKIPL